MTVRTRRPPDRRPRRKRVPSARSPFWLAVVSLGFVLAEVLVVTPRTYLSWDEALYISQFSTKVPAMGIDAHRSLGVPLLVAPIAAVTASVPAIRIYLSVLAGVGLFLAYRPWLRVSPAATLAALLFAGMSVTLTNGNVALPNLFAALGAVAGVGFFVTAVRHGGTSGAVTGLVVAFAVLSLVRPTDAIWMAIPVLMAAFVVPSWRARASRPAAAVAGGLAIGGAVWIVEAYARFGGPLSRLAMMREITAAGGNLVLLDQVAALGRKMADGPWSWVLLGGVLQWSVVAGLLVLGMRTARRTLAVTAWRLAFASAAAGVSPYLLLLSYPSGRYLLPAAALLALPVAGGVVRVLTVRPPGRAAPALVTSATVVIVAAYVGSQLWTARQAAENSREARRAGPPFAEGLRDLGVRPPCRVSGSFAPQIAYVPRCSASDIALAARRASVDIGSWAERHPESVPALTTRDRRIAHSNAERLVVVARSARRPVHLSGWTRVKVLPDRPWYAYFPPDHPPGRGP